MDIEKGFFLLSLTYFLLLYFVQNQQIVAYDVWRNTEFVARVPAVTPNTPFSDYSLNILTNPGIYSYSIVPVIVSGKWATFLVLTLCVYIEKFLNMYHQLYTHAHTRIYTQDTHSRIPIIQLFVAYPKTSK